MTAWIAAIVTTENKDDRVDGISAEPLSDTACTRGKHSNVERFPLEKETKNTMWYVDSFFYQSLISIIYLPSLMFFLEIIVAIHIFKTVVPKNFVLDDFFFAYFASSLSRKK